jgi:sialidase-1
MANIHKRVYRQDGKEKSVLLSVNPESYSRRDHITLNMSFDDGNNLSST